MVHFVLEPKFLENLKRQKEIEREVRETQAQLELRQKAAAKKAEEERIEEKKEQAFRLAREAKKQFYESGLPDLIHKLLKVYPKLNFEIRHEAPEEESYDFRTRHNMAYSSYGYDYYRGNEKHVSVVILHDVEDYNDEPVTKVFFQIVTTHDGIIRFNGGWRGSSIVPKDIWKNNTSVLEEALGKAYKHPQKIRIGPRYESPYENPSGGGPCLHGNSLISVPKGFVLIKNLKSGDLVWTVDRFGHKIKAVIVQKTRRLVSKDHKVVHITLEDGRKLIVSPGHPTIDNKELGSLKKGQILDKSQITSIQIMPYKEKYTYDILPSGDTGGYWANDILIGSTLSSQFKKVFEFT